MIFYNSLPAFSLSPSLSISLFLSIYLSFSIYLSLSLARARSLSLFSLSLSLSLLCDIINMFCHSIWMQYHIGRGETMLAPVVTAPMV